MIDLIHKDLRLAAATAKEFDVRLDTAAAAAKLFADASAAGAGALDCTALAVTLGADVQKATISVTLLLVLPTGRTSTTANHLTC